MDSDFDIIILGGGGAGLSCAMELAPSGKKVLIIEKELKNKNDRTWSFWEKGKGKYDHLVRHRWNKIDFHADSSRENLAIAPYQYKMIRSSDFYEYAHICFSKYNNIQYLQAEVQHVKEHKTHVQITCDKGDFTAHTVLDSITIPDIDKRKHQYVAQHFAGWFVETEEDVFNSNTANLMDFRMPQEGATRFFYVLPTSSKRALIEIAIFSNDILTQDQYDKEILAYIDQYMNLGKYKIEEKELGVIPMTSYPFHKDNTARIIKIGTAGGWVKPSSGYAFKRIMDRSERLVKQLLSGEKPAVHSSWFHRWLDDTMLKAWNEGYVNGKQVFQSLFSKRNPSEVFEFLDEESAFFQELKVMYSCPIIPMTKAALF